MKSKKVLAALLTVSMALSPVQSMYVFGAEADIFSDGEGAFAEEEQENLPGEEMVDMIPAEENSEADLFLDSEEDAEPVFTDEAAESAQSSAATGMNVAYHTQAEIKAMADTIDLNKQDTFLVEPSSSQPYNPGILDDATIQNSLNALNFVRYIAGIPYDVKIDPEYQKQAQAAAYLNMINNKLSHGPGKPEGMDDELYNLGSKGAGSSNIASGLYTLLGSIASQWMADDDPVNATMVGHRRWCLDPEMKKTGFGSAGYYRAMYAWDGALKKTDYCGVAWPAQNTPLEFFHNGRTARMPWSFSVGDILGVSFGGNYAHVKLERKKDGRVWEFDTRSDVPSDGELYVSNANVGMYGSTIIFIPKGIEGYEDGDSFHVDIFGTDYVNASYDVNFFQMHQHNGGTATCTTQAICRECGKRYGPLADHEYVKYTVSAPSCEREGEEYERCKTCRQEKEGSRIKIPALGHDWSEWETKEATCAERGYKKRTCKRCSESDYQEIPALPHELFDFVSYKASVNAYSSSFGQKIKRCKICDGIVGNWETIYAPKTIELSQESFAYDGKVHKPSVTVKDSTGAIIPAEHYTVAYSGNCTDTGKYDVTVTFCGNYYEGTFGTSFTIVGDEIPDEKPEHKHTWGEWVVEKKGAANGAEGLMKRKCTECSDGEQTQTIYAPTKIKLSKDIFTYNGNVQKPSVVVMDTEGITISEKEYLITFSGNCKDVGNYNVVVTFNSEKYEGKLSASFTIAGNGSSEHTHEWSEWNVKSKGGIVRTSETTSEVYNGFRTRTCSCHATDGETIYGPKPPVLSQIFFDYTGKVQRPSVTVVDMQGKPISADNYTLSWSGDCIEPGSYKAIVTFHGPLYEGEGTTEFRIKKAEHPHKWGEWQVTKKATPSLNGSKKRTCPTCNETETKVIYRQQDLLLSQDTFEYNGKIQKPAVTVKHVNNVVIDPSEYTVTYSGNCKDAGKYKVTVTFNGKEYEGTMTADFEIKKHIHEWSDWSIKKATPSAEGYRKRTCACGEEEKEIIYRPSTVVWEKNIIVKGEPMPKFRVLDSQGNLMTTHYYATYPEDWNEVGVHEVEIHFANDDWCEGTMTASYEVIEAEQHTHKWSDWEVIEKGELRSLPSGNMDCLDGYKRRRCSCGAEESESFAGPCSPLVSQIYFDYNGKVQKPTVIVRDADGNTIPESNYTISYSGDCKQAGAYKVTVTYCGSYYKGEGYAYFVINENPDQKEEETTKNVTISMVSSGTKVYAGASKSLGVKTNTSSALTYKTSDSKTATVKNGKVYAKKPGTVKITVTATPKSAKYKKTSKSITINVIPVKPAIPSASRKGNYITATIKKVNYASGYQFQYATNNKMSGYKAENVKGTTYKFKARTDKNYYVRVRSYTRLNGKTYYSGWSSIRKIKAVKAS